MEAPRIPYNSGYHLPSLGWECACYCCGPLRTLWLGTYLSLMAEVKLDNSDLLEFFNDSMYVTGGDFRRVDKMMVIWCCKKTIVMAD